MAFAFSILCHAAAAGALIWAQGAEEVPVGAGKGAPILISYVKTAPPRKAAKLPRPPAPAARPAAAKPPVKKKTLALKQPVMHRQFARPAPELKTSAAAIKTEAKTSEELLADPEKGKVFSAYFGRVKQTLQGHLEKNYLPYSEGRGTVTLIFILSPDGKVENVSVVGLESDADDAVKKLAIECVRSAAPFGRFPGEMGLDKIAFRVTIYFEES